MIDLLWLLLKWTCCCNNVEQFDIWVFTQKYATTVQKPLQSRHKMTLQSTLCFTDQIISKVHRLLIRCCLHTGCPSEQITHWYNEQQSAQFHCMTPCFSGLYLSCAFYNLSVNISVQMCFAQVAFHIQPYKGRTDQSMHDNIKYIIDK